MSTSEHDTAFKLIGIDTDHEFNHGRIILVRQLVDSVWTHFRWQRSNEQPDWNDGSKDCEIEVKSLLTSDQKSTLKTFTPCPSIIRLPTMATLTLSRMRNQTTDGVNDELRAERSIGGRSGEALVRSTRNSRSQSEAVSKSETVTISKWAV